MEFTDSDSDFDQKEYYEKEISIDNNNKKENEIMQMK